MMDVKRKGYFDMKKSHGTAVLIILLLCGVVLGGFIGSLAGGTGAFGWLDYGQTFGLSSPLVLDLGVVALTFGLTIRISVAGILGVCAAFLAYRLL